MDECRERLPGGWTEIIARDPVLLDILEEHEYDLEQEAVKRPESNGLFPNFKFGNNISSGRW